MTRAARRLTALAAAGGLASSLLLISHAPTAVCRYRSSHGQQTPDPRCTPGDTDPTITAAQLCPHPHTSARRAVTNTTRQQTIRSYGTPDGAFHGEVDHLISLELGGSNAPNNLWPETTPTFNPKDLVEAHLHTWLCQQPTPGRLSATQTAIRTDWTTAERITR